MKNMLRIFMMFFVCMSADSYAAKANIKTVVPRAVDGLISHLVQCASTLNADLPMTEKIDALSSACDEYCVQRRMSESVRCAVLAELVQRYEGMREPIDPLLAVFECGGDVISHVDWDDEGKIFGVSPVGRMHVWSQQKLRSWHEHNVYVCEPGLMSSSVQSVSADGSCAVIAMQPDPVIRLRKKVGRSWREQGELVGHTGMITSACLSNDGSMIVSASVDRTIRIWEKYGDDWVCSRIFIGHRKPVFSVSLNEEATMVVSGSLDATVRVWRMYRPLEEVLAFFVRNVFPEQWGPYQELLAAQVHELSAGLR